MVGGATSPVDVVVAAGPRRSGQRRERPQMTGGAQPPIPHRPGQDHLPLPGSSGADPKPYLELRIPALWLYGTADREVPVDQSVALLDRLTAQGKDVTVVTFPDAGHGLLDSPPTDPKAPTTFVDWVRQRARAEAEQRSS